MKTNTNSFRMSLTKLQCRESIYNSDSSSSKENHCSNHRNRIWTEYLIRTSDSKGTKQLVLKRMPSYALCSRPLSDPSNNALLRIKGPFYSSRRCDGENNLLRKKKWERKNELVRAKLRRGRGEKNLKKRLFTEKDLNNW